MNQAVKEFIAGKKFAVVGVSRSGKKFGNSITTELKQRGYQVFIVHPEAKEIAGESCYPNLASLSGKVDGVIICVPPSKASGVLREAVQAGIKNIWVQQGAQSGEVHATARELGVTPVTGKCILMYAAPVTTLHKFHQVVAKLVGQY